MIIKLKLLENSFIELPLLTSEFQINDKIRKIEGIKSFTQIPLKKITEPIISTRSNIDKTKKKYTVLPS